MNREGEVDPVTLAVIAAIGLVGLWKWANRDRA